MELIQAKDCDSLELSCVNEALIAENKELRDQLAKQTPTITDLDVLKARLGIHLASTGVLYSALAAAMANTVDWVSGKWVHTGFLDHPYTAAILLSLNVLGWTITSVVRKFGAAQACTACTCEPARRLPDEY